MTLKHTLKLFVPLLFVLLFLGVSTPSLAKAYSFKDDSGVKTMAEKAQYNTEEKKEIESYIGDYLKLLFSFLGVVFLIIIVYAGIVWMTAQGNSSEVKNAQGMIKSSIIGLIVILLAYAATFFIVNSFQNQKVDYTSGVNQYYDSEINTNNNSFELPTT